MKGWLNAMPSSTTRKNGQSTFRTHGRLLCQAAIDNTNGIVNAMSQV
jgi:hypothetical protein